MSSFRKLANEFGGAGTKAAGRIERRALAVSLGVSPIPGTEGKNKIVPLQSVNKMVATAERPHYRVHCRQRASNLPQENCFARVASLRFRFRPHLFSTVGRLPPGPPPPAGRDGGGGSAAIGDGSMLSIFSSSCRAQHHKDIMRTRQQC